MTSGGLLTLHAREAADAASSASGSAASGGSAAIGAGVAITLANVSVDASIYGAASAHGITQTADTTASHDLSAQATSGAGGGSVGIAASLGLVIGNLRTTAGLYGVADANGGDVSLTATSSSTSTAKALPGTSGGGGGSTVGIGASVAINIVNDNAVAEIGVGATLANVHDLTLHASDTSAMTTEARTGASSASVALAPAVAVAFSNVRSRTTIGAGGTLTVAGALEATAQLDASATTTAAGDTHGGTAAVGVAVALTIANHGVESTTQRDLAVGGAATFQALGASSSESDAMASAAGAPGDGAAGAPAGGVDGQVAGERSHADSVAPAGGDSGGTASPSAATSSGGVSVAAAVGVTVSGSSARAYIPAGRHVITGGLLTLRSSANTDAKSKGDGSASSSGSGVSIGAGVALTLAIVTNDAVVETGAIVASHGLTADAGMTDRAGDTTHRFAAESTSGAGGGSVGVAGSISISLVNVDTNAAIRTGASVDATGGDVSLSATSTSESIAKALPGGTIGGSSFGLGISFALSIVNDHAFAGIADGGILVNAATLTLHSSDTSAMTTQAQTGAAGGGVTIVPSIAVAISNVSSDASIGAGPDLTVTTGNVDAKAELAAPTLTTAIRLGEHERLRGDRRRAVAHDREPQRRIDDQAQPRLARRIDLVPGVRLVRCGFAGDRIGRRRAR